MFICKVEGCSRTRPKAKARCRQHEHERLMLQYGPCPNHPHKPIFLPSMGLCNTCVKQRWRQQNLTTDVASPRTASAELAGIIDYIADEIIAVRAELARYHRRVKDQASPRVWVADNLLCLAAERLTPAHFRYLMARINAGAEPQQRITTYRSHP